MAQHRPSALAAYTATGTIVIVATFLPWLRSGNTSRSSYELLGLLDRLDVAPGGWLSLLVRWWPLVPLVVTVAVVLARWRRWLASLAAAIVAVMYAGGVGAALAMGARDTSIRLGPGPAVCAVASAVFLFTAGWMVFSHASGRVAPTPLATPPDDPS